MWENLGLGKSSLRKIWKLARWNLAWMLALGSFCRKAWFWWINLQSVDSKFSYPLGDEYVFIYPESIDPLYILLPRDRKTYRLTVSSYPIVENLQSTDCKFSYPWGENLQSVDSKFSLIIQGLWV